MRRLSPSERDRGHPSATSECAAVTAHVRMRREPGRLPARVSLPAVEPDSTPDDVEPEPDLDAIAADLAEVEATLARLEGGGDDADRTTRSLVPT